MSQNIINTGNIANDGQGDPLRTAFTDTNLNFNQIWAVGPVGSNIQIVNNTIITTNTNGNLILATNGVGTIIAAQTIQPDLANVRMIGTPNNRFNTVYSQYLNVGAMALTGNLTVTGNLYVTGNTVTVNQSNLNVSNTLITMAANATTPVQADGGGIHLAGANADITYSYSVNSWVANIPVVVQGNITTDEYFIGDGSQLSNLDDVINSATLSGNTLNSNILTSSLTTVGILDSLSVAGNINGSNIVGTFFGDGGNLANVVSTAIVGNVANATYSTFAGTANTANLAAQAVTATNADFALNALNANTANNAIFATTALCANVANIAYTAVLANSAVVANVALTVGVLPNLSVSGNITTSGYFLGDGSLISNILVTTTYGNSNVAAYLPTYAGDLGNVGNINLTGSISAAGNVEIDGSSYASYIQSNGNISAAGNITGGNISAAGNITGGNILTGDQVIANGEIQSGTGFFTGGYLSVNGSSDLANANVSGSLSAVGNITGNYILGDGSQLTNLPGAAPNYIVNGNSYANIASADGNLEISADGNTWTFATDGNLTLPGNSEISINYANGDPYGGYPSGNSGAVQINWLGDFSNQGGTPGDTYTTMQFDGDGLLDINGNTAYQPRIDYTPYITVNTPRVESTDFGIVAGPGLTVVGYDDNYNTPRSAYLSVQDQATATQQWDFGILGNGSNNFSVQNRTANTVPLMIDTADNVSAVGNITGNYILGDGSLLTNLPAGNYSNANVANYLPVYTGNITAGNISVVGDITGNLVTFTTAALSNAGDLTSSLIRINQTAPYGSEAYGIELFTSADDDAGIFSSVSAGPDYVALLSSNAGNANVVLQGGYGVTIGTSNISGLDEKTWTFTAAGEFLAAGNVSAVGNVFGTYFLGDGSQLTNLPSGNANTGNVTFDDINIIGTGNLHLQPDPANSSAYLDIYLTGSAGPDIHIAGNGENVIIGRDTGANVLVAVDGTVSIQADAGTPYTWTFGYDGNLTTPGNINFSNNSAIQQSSFDPSPGRTIETVTLRANVQDNATLLYLENTGNANLRAWQDINLNTYTQTRNNNWKFDASGDLTVPGNIIGGNANGILISSDGNVTLSSKGAEFVFDAPAGNLYLPKPNGAIVFPDDSVQTTAYTGILAAAGNAGDIQINVAGNIGADSTLRYVDSGGEMTLYADYLNAPGIFTSDIYAGDGTPSNITLTTSYGIATWTFDTTGNLTLPASGNLIVSSGAIVGSNASPAPYLSGFDSVSAITLSASGNVIATGNANVLSLTTRNGDSNNSYANPQIIMGYAGTADYPSFIHTTHNASTPVDNTIEFWTSDGTQAGTFPANAVLGLTVTNGNIETGNITAYTTISTPLPLANLTAIAGARAFVNNANLAASGNFGAQISGGGSNTVPVWSDGTNWYIG